MTEEVWHAATHAPAALHPLEQQTPLYIDLYVALRILCMPYSRYMQETSQHERYRMFLLLEQAKEDHARERAEQFAEAEREAMAATGQAHSRG
jgi:hypothetical protein